ncbi:hypothetical protein [Aureimonas sp. AU40]|uniref:hypothetical protein n=1 Tax=Aureimonas sp. AU40 TaxID=1637747 RepID=UPI000AC5FAA7|nr:hypothetical protein [Aureimonas sp. AU40]
MATYENMNVGIDNIPPEMKAVVPYSVTTSEFETRLREGGTMELSGSVWKIGDGPDFEANSASFIALDTLTLTNSQIVTYGNTLTIFVNRLVCNNSELISFPDDVVEAWRGADGNYTGARGMPGSPGDSGGAVSIHVLQEIEGTLNVNLRGQNGGTGGDGQKGDKGATGPRGQNAVSIWTECKRSGQDGGVGAVGLPGGNAGDGGSGGQGGVFYLFRVNEKISSASYSFSASGGRGGRPGHPGIGGDGGDGGEGGHGDGWCGGGNRGSQGPQGPTGAEGNPGADAGDGTVIAKSIPLEVSIRIAASGGVLTRESADTF